MSIFSESDLEILKSCIEKAEKATSGEIRLHVEAICSHDVPEKRAHEVFQDLGMHQTEQKNAILIYLAFESKKFVAPPRTPDTIKPVLRGVWFDPVELVTTEAPPKEDTKKTEKTDSEKQVEKAPISVDGAIQGAHSILYFVNKDDPRGPQPTNPGNDPQFARWEYPVSLWKANLMEATGNKPKEKDPKPSN